MIDLQKFTLSNGLTVLLHKDTTTPLAAVNLLYDVGSKDEDPDRTGFAHLFEHLMFEGSVNIPHYDEPLQKVGGQNNAFTSADITNYYITLPAENLETALWLESDRMLDLAFSEEKLGIQKNVVIEEFKQVYLNQPYGDVWLLLRPLVYKKHPYQWPTIGKETAHIENADLETVKTFYQTHYHPKNAILSIGGNIEIDKTLRAVEAWFGSITAPKEKRVRQLELEPRQDQSRQFEKSEDVPFDAIYKAYRAAGRRSAQYYASDLISDLLGRGESSRLHRQLVREKQLFSELDAFHSGDLEDGMLIIEGKVVAGVAIEEANKAIEEEVHRLIEQFPDERELEKVKNKVQSSHLFSMQSVLNKTMEMAFHQLLGDANEINEEVNHYRAITQKSLKDTAEEMLRSDNASTLLYKRK